MLRTRQAGIRAESRVYGPDTSGDSQKLENIEDGQGERHCPFCSPAPLGPSFPTLHRGKAWSRATAMYRASNGKIRLGQHPKTCSVEEKEWYVCAESPLQHPQISRETQGGTEVRDASLAGTTAEWLVGTRLSSCSTLLLTSTLEVWAANLSPWGNHGTSIH